jgi:hypothetical protein
MALFEMPVANSQLLSALIIDGGIREPVVMTGAVRANHCIPMDQGIFYFEVQILECARDE